MENQNFSKIQNSLIAKEKYSVIHSALMSADILNYYEESVKNAILAWADDQDVTLVEINGYCVKDIMEEVGCSAFQALCILQSIGVDPNCFKNAVLMLYKE